MVPEKIISFRMKRESGENPEQYPLLKVPLNDYRIFATGVDTGKAR